MMKWIISGIGGFVLGAAGTIGAALYTVPEAKHQAGVTLPLADPMDLPTYDTLEEAGVHAIERDYKCSHAYECGGVIAQRPDGKYVVGPVHSEMQGDSVQIPTGVPKGWKLAADHHIHPCLAVSHEVAYFSPQDIEGSLAQNIPSFMGDMCTGKVHEFDPAKDSPNNEEPVTSPGIHITQGRIIGQIAVDGISMEPNTGL